MPLGSLARTAEARTQDEFPAPRFPSGVAVAPTVLLVVLLVAAASLLGLRSSGGGQGGGLGPVGWPGLLPGIAVTAVALWVYLTLLVLVVRPVQRLRDVVVAGHYSDGSACRSRIREIDRVATALDMHRPGVRRSGAHRRPRMSLRMLLIVITVALVGWLTAAFAVAASGQTISPAELVTDSREDAASAAAALRHGLQDGLSGLQAVSGSARSALIGDLRTAAAGTLAVRPIFQAVHAVDQAGRPVTSVGSGSRLDGPTPQAGIAQLNSVGSEPIVVATAPIGDGAYSLVAEYDIRALNALLDHSEAPTRVLDAGLRTVLSSGGYQAFTELSDPVLRDAATTALNEGPTTTTQVINGVPSAVASHPVGFNDAAATLGWVVLQDQSLGAAGFAQDVTDRAALVVIGTSIGAVLLAFAWMYVATVRPLRQLGDHAEAIARMRDGGPVPEPVAPQRIDEVGAIAAGLNRLLIVATRNPLEDTHVLPTISPRPPAVRSASGPSARRIPGPRSCPRPVQVSLAPDVVATAIFTARSVAPPAAMTEVGST